MHINGFLHRDIKAANLLIDDDGTVLLGDLGVAASVCDEEAAPVTSGSSPPVYFEPNSEKRGKRGTPQVHSNPSTAPKRLGKRKSFVGTVSERLRIIHKGASFFLILIFVC